MHARGDDQFPEGMAPVLVSGRGCRVRDVDGLDYVEYGSGLRSVTLGHAEPRLIRAATRAMRLGTGMVRPTLLEAEVAEELVDLVEAADMVKFAKNGSDVTTAAVRLARSVNGRDLVAGCEDHQDLRTLFAQETIIQCVFAPSFVVGAAHDDQAIERTVEALASALAVDRRALEDGVDDHLRGRPVGPVFWSPG